MIPPAQSPSIAMSNHTPEKQLNRLRNQIVWVTRISTALSATKNVDDLISVILAALVSPTGLGFSRVLLFEHDVTQFKLRGRYALFHQSRESIQALAKDMEDDARFLEERTEDQEASGYDLGEESMHSLENSGPWIVLFQQLNPDNELTRKLKELEFDTVPAKRRADGGTLFQSLPLWKKPHALGPEALGCELPEALSALLPSHFAVIPMFTNKGLRAVLFADRHLEDNGPISETDLEELSWFSRQAALAIENAEINSDLQNAYEELKQLDQMKSNFLSVISHELRTPLTAMSGFVDLLLEERVGEINENQRMLMSRVQKNTGHLIHLVNDLIEVAEVEVEGAVEVRLRPVEPLGVLMDVLPRLDQRRRQKSVKVVPVVDCEIPNIQADDRALGRIFFHLLDNAIKFSPDETVVEVHFRANKDCLHIDISDQGVGIPPEHLSRIFTQFYQVDNTLTRGHEGLGLGLAVTKMLIKASHGQIDVASEVNEGSTFTVTYPIYHPRRRGT